MSMADAVLAAELEADDTGAVPRTASAPIAITVTNTLRSFDTGPSSHEPPYVPAVDYYYKSPFVPVKCQWRDLPCKDALN